MTARAVIVEAAINGATSKETNPNVPTTVEEIATDALAAFDAGAAIVHTHCNPTVGPDAEIAERYLASFRIVWRAQPGALIYPTVNLDGGQISVGHLAPMAAEGLRIGILDPGSVNLGFRGDDGLPSGSFVYANSFDRIKEGFALHRQLGLGPSLAIYEPGFLYTVLQYWKAGKLPAGSMVKFYFSSERGLYGTPFGLPPTRAGLEAYLDLLGDAPIPWAVSVVGGDVCRHDVAELALQRGGHLHLGLEFYGGNRQPTNAELVREAVELCERVGRPVAGRDEAARILGLS